MITKAERTELKSIVKQQIRVLRSEVYQREAELRAEIHRQITERFADDDQKWAGLAHKVHEITMEANRAVNDALYQEGFQVKGNSERLWFATPAISPPRQKRDDLFRAAVSDLTAKVKDAQMRLDRQEADLLRTLVVGALETDEARAFLDAIPTVSELVPASRLAELEASLTGKKDDA